MRRYRQFRVRTILLLMCVVSVALAAWTSPTRRRIAALKSIEPFARVEFVDPSHSNKMGSWQLGRSRVRSIEFYFSQDFSAAVEFPELRSLRVGHHNMFSDDLDLPIPDWAHRFPPEVVSPLDVSPLANLVDLEELQLNGISIRTLSSLRPLRKLQTLSVAKTGISEIGVVRHFPNLTAISLRGTQVRDLSALDSLEELKLLDVRETPLTNGQVDAFARTHPKCDIVR